MPDTASAEPNPRHSPNDRRSPSGPPRWVKVSGIIALVVIALLIALMLSGGDHGPGRHEMELNSCAHTQTPKVAESAPCQA